MKNLSKIIFIICILLQSTAFSKDIFLNKNAKWSGLGYQEDTNSSWKIELEKISKNSYKINYPTIPCAGIWKVEKTEKNRIILKEVITENIDNCVPVNRVIITKIDNEHLSVSYFMVDENTNHIYAFGVLQMEK
jgi:hypothetical protein